MRSLRPVPPWIAVALALLPAAVAAGPAWAHAMPQRSSPRAGATLTSAPTEVSILFDDELQAGRCKLRVEDAHQHIVSLGAARVDPGHPRRLSVALRPLGPGRYHVSWVAVSRDGHRTEGDYDFSVSR